MNWGLGFALVTWGLFLFAWLPVTYIRHKRRMRSLRAMNKGHRLTLKYKAIRQLTGRSS